MCTEKNYFIRGSSVKRILAIMGAALMLHAPVNALSVIDLELDQIIDNATYAFEGKVLESRSEIEAGSRLIVTHITFEVKDTFKGTLPARYTIKQIGGEKIAGGRLFPNVSYVVGETYAVFLTGVSATGFSSPVGLHQGKFRIEGEGANRRASNGKVMRVTQALDGAVADGTALEPRASFDLNDLKMRTKARVSRMERK
jgi:hypothetical protein